MMASDKISHIDMETYRYAVKRSDNSFAVSKSDITVYRHHFTVVVAIDYVKINVLGKLFNKAMYRNDRMT